MKLNRNQRAFFALVKAGLWEQNVQLSQYGKIDFKEVYRLSQEQSVVGLVAAGLEHVTDYAVPKDVVLNFVGASLQLEQRNRSMNQFLEQLQGWINEEGIKAILVKGQGVAQCYEKPLWRAAGDIDLILDSENYEKAKSLLKPLAKEVAEENTLTKHQALTIQGFDVELHGRMPFLLSKRVDAIIDEIIDKTTKYGQVRTWTFKNSDIALPAVDNDVILVFTHFLHHFFIEGVGLRQICDWCRLLWTYRTEINVDLLKQRLLKMSLMTEWKVFASLAVETLEMPLDAMPFYDSQFKSKGERVLNRVLKSGNMGHNNDQSYHVRYKGLSYKIVALWKRFCDFLSFLPIFPVDAPKFFVTYVVNKAKGDEVLRLWMIPY